MLKAIPVKLVFGCFLFVVFRSPGSNIHASRLLVPSAQLSQLSASHNYCQKDKMLIQMIQIPLEGGRSNL